MEGLWDLNFKFECFYMKMYLFKVEHFDLQTNYLSSVFWFDLYLLLLSLYSWRILNRDSLKLY